VHFKGAGFRAHIRVRYVEQTQRPILSGCRKIIRMGRLYSIYSGGLSVRNTHAPAMKKTRTLEERKGAAPQFSRHAPQAGLIGAEAWQDFF
jgi:hypothetical protein